ncbi:MAG: amidohydrolase family protein [Clostridia bacterium]|nr:amidohydrolase family protein [Clostridia bacterium]
MQKIKCIDFHTHIFPDALAPRAIAALVEGGKHLYLPNADGTKDGLIEFMDRSGIDVSVVMPVITKQSQTVKTNEFSVAVLSDRIRAFGGIFPNTDDYKRDIDFVVSLGLPGIKIHAEYQDFIVDDPKMLKIYDYAFSKGLMIMQHAGFDPAFEAPFRSNPKMFANAMKQLGGGTMIAAHFGGQSQWDEVEKYIVGTNIYIDTSMGFDYYSEEQFMRIVKNHGSDKVLFGTDSPWSNSGKERERLLALPLPVEDKENILHKNAERLLGI